MQTDYTLKLALQPSYKQVDSSESTSIRSLSEEILLEIFKILNLKDLSSTTLVCRHWKQLAIDSSTVYGLYLNELKSIESLCNQPARFSGWMPMPQHWGLHTKENSVHFSSLGDDIISFYPPFCKQSSQFFSFTQSLPFSDRNILLDHYKYTYFLTPQGQTLLKLELQTNLQPLASHRLVAINSKQPTQFCEFSLLRDLPPTEENLSRCQIEYCFAISETNIVIVTSGGEISFWNLSNSSPNCYKIFQIDRYSKVYRIEGYLILNDHLLDLKNLSLIPHEFKFVHKNISTYKSSFCVRDKNELSYFIINNQGILEKKWSINLTRLLGELNESNFFEYQLKDMNENFLLLERFERQAFNMLVLNIKGEVVLSIKEKVSGEELDPFCLYMYPTFAHLSNNILIYKNPREYPVNFWHIPTKKHIQKFDWTKAIYDLPLSVGDCLVQDLRLSQGKLTFLFSTAHTPLSNQPAKYRLIQFNPQHAYEQGFTGLLKRVFTVVKSVYYAFPGRPKS